MLLQAKDIAKSSLVIGVLPYNCYHWIRTWIIID